MGCCNIATNIIRGIFEGEEPDPPVQSDYCVQWSEFATQIFFPCGDGTQYLNGNFSQGELCGGTFDIADFQGSGNLFRYTNLDSGWYIQVIRPIENAALSDFGVYGYDVFGNPSGDIPINDIQNSNCFVNCYTAVVEVDDVNTDTISGFEYNNQAIDMTGDVPFNDPGHVAWVLSRLIGWLEPSATYEVSWIGNTVTMTITTIMTMNGGNWSNGITTQGTFNFEPCP